MTDKKKTTTYTDVEFSLYKLRLQRHLINTALRAAIDSVTAYDYENSTHSDIYWAQLAAFADSVVEDFEYWKKELPKWEFESTEAARFDACIPPLASSELAHGYRLLLA